MRIVKSVASRVESNSNVLSVVAVPNMKNIVRLSDDNQVEVLAFLRQRPVHTVVMMSFIKDNGLDSELNRGKFFGYRNEEAVLEGVALIGHTTLIEARTDDALHAFAIQARTSETPIHVMMSEGKAIERFWSLYRQDATEPRLSFTEKLFELNFPFPVQECEWDITLADHSQIEQIAEAHAEVAFIESGVNPLEKDREGFLKRCARRIDMERTFVVFENGKLLFKADIAAETEDVFYIEGVYVAPEARGRGIGPKCLSKLSAELLGRVENICMLSNRKFEKVHASFEKAGYKSTDECTTIFV
ncbi:MAG: GNAT family N-acetyltransferase [Pyrinomonadaceae bacterium]